MHLFLDESGRIDRDGMFALGGIAVRDTDWPHLRDVWQETLRAHGWPLDRELKWHGIRNGNVRPRSPTTSSTRSPQPAAPRT